MATPIKISIPHQLGKAEARRRIEQGFGQLQSQGGALPLGNLQQAWSADRLMFSASTLGQRMGGRLDVDEREVRIEVDLPAFLSGFADAIAGKLKSQGRLLLEKK